jgi:hypothetical protein
MLPTTERYNGVSNQFVPVPTRDPDWLFSGLDGPQEVTKMKEIIMHDLRLYGLEKFLDQDISELAPDKEDYDLKIPSERRLLQADKQRLVEDAARAWTLVRNRFKKGSPAEALIKPTEQTGALNVLWKIFLTQYDNRTNRRGALELMQKFFDNDIKYNSDLIAHFIFLQDTIQEIQGLATKPENTVQVGISTPLNTRIDFSTDTERISRFSSVNTPTAVFPGWFPTILLLMRLAQLPNHKEFIKKFIFEYLVKSYNQRLEDISVAACYEHLKTFSQIHNKSDLKGQPTLQAYQTTAATSQPLFCSFHGPNPSHSTKECLEINRQNQSRSRSTENRPYARDQYTSPRKSVKYNRSPSPYPYNRGIRDNRRGYSRSRSNSRDRRNPQEGRNEGSWSSPRVSNFYAKEENHTARRINNYHTEANISSEGDYEPAVYSSELPPQFARTPPHYAYDSEYHPDSEPNVSKECNHVVLYCSIAERTAGETESKKLIADNACNAVLFNKTKKHLVFELEPIEGTIYGALGHKHGAITHRGFVHFMGVKPRCFIGNITKSCIGMNYLSVYYGFVFKIEGRILQIYSKRSGRATELIMNTNLLSEMPESLFGNIEIDANITTLDPKDLYTLMHCRLGHPNERKIRHMAATDRYRERGISLDESDMTPRSQYCDICAEAKGHEVVSHKEVDKETCELGLVWHVDLPAQSDTPAIVTGNRSRILFTERKSRFRVYIPFKDNTEPNVLAAVQLWHHRYIRPIKEEYGRTRPLVVVHLHADNGEMKYPKVREYVEGKMYFQHFTAPAHSSSNGVAEVGIKGVRTVSRALMATYKLPEEFRERAESHAVYLLNRLPFMYRGRYAVDPLTVYTGKTADYSILRIFGSKVHAFVYTKKDGRPRSIHGIFVGFAADSNTPLIYLPTENDFINNANIEFREAAENPMETQVPPLESQWNQETFQRIANFLQSEMTQI